MIEFRKADINDIDILVKMRKAQLVDEGIQPTNIDKELYEFFHKHLEDQTLVQWLSIIDEEIVSSCAILYIELPPTYPNASGIRGYITNVYTLPNYRNKGLASMLLDYVVEDCQARGVKKIILSASSQGKSLYLRYGFKQENIWLELDL